MDPLAARDAGIRLAVFETFLRDGSPPPVERLMADLHLAREDVESSLDRLDQARHLKLVPGTHRILMAFPFSAISTPYVVVLNTGRRYFANCAWDSIAFHHMLNEPIRVDSYCFECGRPISFQIRDGQVTPGGNDAPLVYLGLPAAEWWKDIISTCANTMLFFGGSEHVRSWRRSHPEDHGVELKIEVLLKLSEPLYRGKMELGFSRPSRDQLVQLFQQLGLAGEFWQI
jgi:Alkylmercury lyase